MANRLSANPNNSVLLIEAGPRFVDFYFCVRSGLKYPSDTIDPSIPIPYLSPTLSSSIVSWNYTTVPQTGLGGRTIAYPRGRTLGGSTSISTLATFRGHQWGLSIPQIIWFGLVDRQATSIDLPKSLAILDGRGNLCFQRSLRYSPLSLFKLRFGTAASDRSPQVETLVPPPDGHNTTGEINPMIHGLNGPVEISVQDTTPLDSRIFNTTMQLAEFPFNEDANSGDPIGIGAFCRARLYSTR